VVQTVNTPSFFSIDRLRARSRWLTATFIRNSLMGTLLVHYINGVRGGRADVEELLIRVFSNLSPNIMIFSSNGTRDGTEETILQD